MFWARMIFFSGGKCVFSRVNRNVFKGLCTLGIIQGYFQSQVVEKLQQQTEYQLRCPETLFISHENANFLFSVFRVGQGEAKTPKIIGCCRANFAFLSALKIGTFLGKWTSEWVFKTSLFVRLALYFLNQQQTCFFFDCFSTMPNRNCKKTFDLEHRTVQKITFCLSGWKPI